MFERKIEAALRLVYATSDARAPSLLSRLLVFLPTTPTLDDTHDAVSLVRSSRLIQGDATVVPLGFGARPGSSRAAWASLLPLPAFLFSPPSKGADFNDEEATGRRWFLWRPCVDVLGSDSLISIKAEDQAEQLFVG